MELRKMQLKLEVISILASTLKVNDHSLAIQGVFEPMNCENDSLKTPSNQLYR